MPLPTHHLSLYNILDGKKSKRAVRTMAYVFGIGGNVVVIPQIIQAWTSKAPGLSITTWVLFVCSSMFWLVYAIQQRQRPLVVGYLVCIVFDGAVVAGWCFNNLLH